MISNQLADVGNARLGHSAALRHGSIALLAADAYLLPQEKCAPVADRRSWQEQLSEGPAMFGFTGAGRCGAPAKAKGSNRIDAVQGGHITDVHVADTTTFTTSSGPPPRRLPV